MAKLLREIDFDADIPCKIYNMGYVGEHNATTIKIYPPAELIDASDNFCVVVETGGQLIHSAITGGVPIEFDLHRELTQNEYFNLQVEGYKTDDDGNNIFVGKSKMIKGLRLSASVEGESDLEGVEIEDAASQIASLLPTKLSQFADDEGHRLVTDEQVESWNGVKDNKESIENINETLETVENEISIDRAFMNKLDSEKADKTDIPVVPTKVSAFENDKGYLTEHQSLNGYATENWVEGKGYLTQHQDISYKADKSEIPTIPTKVSAFTNDMGYLTQHQDISGKADKSEIPSLNGYATEEWVNDKGYLTEHQSLADYALKTEIPSTDNFVSKADVEPIVFNFVEGDFSDVPSFADIYNAWLKKKPVYVKYDNKVTIECSISKPTTPIVYIAFCLANTQDYEDRGVEYHVISVGAGNHYTHHTIKGNSTGGITEIPVASEDTLGGIKVGNNLTISEDGVLESNVFIAGDDVTWDELVDAYDEGKFVVHYDGNAWYTLGRRTTSTAYFVNDLFTYEQERILGTQYIARKGEYIRRFTKSNGWTDAVQIFVPTLDDIVDTEEYEDIDGYVSKNADKRIFSAGVIQEHYATIDYVDEAIGSAIGGSY